MKVKSYIQILLGLVFILVACKDDKVFQGKHDPEVIKTYHNQPTEMTKMDSIESVNFITKQKLTEIYELTSLFSVNKNDSLMRDILYPQIEGYFTEGDSINIRNILAEMDSLKVNFVEISALNLPIKDSMDIDSVRIVNYKVNYYSSDKKLIDSFNKSAEYILKQEPKKFKHEFVFYFTNFAPFQEVKDTISEEVTQ